MAKPDGGPAFPGGVSITNFAKGMTLRDWFASQVICMAAHDIADPPDIANRAYAVADAMLKERDK